MHSQTSSPGAIFCKIGGTKCRVRGLQNGAPSEDNCECSLKFCIVTSILIDAIQLSVVEYAYVMHRPQLCCRGHDASKCDFSYMYKICLMAVFNFNHWFVNTVPCSLPQGILDVHGHPKIGQNEVIPQMICLFQWFSVYVT